MPTARLSAAPALSVGLFLLGCSDYNLAGKEAGNPGGSDTGAAPALLATPEIVDESGACPTLSVPVELRNVGTAPLDLLSLGATGDWVVSGVSLPLSLGAGEAVAVAVEGAGTGELRVESTDPARPLLTVPLSATPDEAPEIEVLDPSTNTVLEVGSVLLSAAVGDLEDPGTALVVSWDSSVEGALGSGTADAGGNSFVSWPAPRTEGEHLLTATVTDTCGNSSSVEVGVCQQAGYTVDELDLSSWQFEGDAQWDSTNDWLQLTRAAPNLVGAAFATDASVDAGNVEINFRFYIGDGTGADGISLTALDVDRMSTYLGGTGCGIGYGGDADCTEGPALPGWSLEVDTFDNGTGVEPTADDHLAFTFNGDVDGYVAWAALPEMEDTGWHDMSVVVAAPQVTVSIDGTTYIDTTLSGDFGFDAYVGFTAGTGGQTNTHLIDSLSVTETVCE